MSSEDRRRRRSIAYDKRVLLPLAVDDDDDKEHPSYHPRCSCLRCLRWHRGLTFFLLLATAAYNIFLLHTYVVQPHGQPHTDLPFAAELEEKIAANAAGSAATPLSAASAGDAVAAAWQGLPRGWNRNLARAVTEELEAIVVKEELEAIAATATVGDDPDDPFAPMPLSVDAEGIEGTEAIFSEDAKATLSEVPSRHPRWRLAFTVPWIGSKFPSWFPYFLQSAERSAFIADWVIFHEGSELPESSEIPSNVIFHNLGKHGLGLLFGQRLATALELDNEPTTRLVALFRVAFREFSYVITEYKPTHGWVFADYISEYSHWSYTDIDILMGDLPIHIDREELEARLTPICSHLAQSVFHIQNHPILLLDVTTRRMILSLITLETSFGCI